MIEHTQMNITDASKASIALMCDEINHEGSSAYDLFKRSGFIGIGESGCSDGSTDYKAIIASAALSSD